MKEIHPMRARGAMRFLIFCSSFGFALGGCKQPSERNGMLVKKSLYDRLGSEPAITKVVDDFVGRAASDPKVNFTRKGAPQEWRATDENLAHLKTKLVQFLASAAGGPQS